MLVGKRLILYQFHQQIPLSRVLPDPINFLYLLKQPLVINRPSSTKISPQQKLCYSNIQQTQTQGLLKTRARLQMIAIMQQKLIQSQMLFRLCPDAWEVVEAMRLEIQFRRLYEAITTQCGHGDSSNNMYKIKKQHSAGEKTTQRYTDTYFQQFPKGRAGMMQKRCQDKKTISSVKCESKYAINAQLELSTGNDLEKILQILDMLSNWLDSSKYNNSGDG